MTEPDIGDRGVADYLIASKQCDILCLEQLLRTGRLVVSISNLVHALQRERGVSNMFVASDGRRCLDQLADRVADSREMERQFRERLREIDTEAAGSAAGSRLFSRIAYALHGLNELDQVRGAIRERKMSPEHIIDGYSELIQGLLAVVFEAADTAADPDISRVLVAMFHLMQGKEFAGQERAVGAAGFARGGFGSRLAERLRHLIDNQERCFQIFTGFADADSMAAWRDGDCCAGSAEMERLRRIALTTGADGEADTDLSDTWFTEATHRIDAMKQVEDQLEASLDALCKRKLADAREDLRSHRNLIDALGKQPVQQGAFAVFVNEGLAAGAQPEPASYSTDCASPQLGRSLVELVQSQSQRLQAMSDELNEARTALAERKRIEKAKGLIMKHRGLTEEEAYKFLRQLAMAQSRRLADVAADAINMADIFNTGSR